MKPSFKLDVSLWGFCVKLETELNIWLLKLKAGKFYSLDVSEIFRNSVPNLLNPTFPVLLVDPVDIDDCCFITDGQVAVDEKLKRLLP